MVPAGNEAKRFLSVNHTTKTIHKFNPDKREKTCFRWSYLLIDYISDYKPQIVFMGLYIENDKPRMNSELRVMIAELKSS